jgi:hypothetical protein
MLLESMEPSKSRDIRSLSPSEWVISRAFTFQPLDSDGKPLEWVSHQSGFVHLPSEHP